MMGWCFMYGDDELCEIPCRYCNKANASLQLPVLAIVWTAYHDFSCQCWVFL